MILVKFPTTAIRSRSSRNRKSQSRSTLVVLSLRLRTSKTRTSPSSLTVRTHSSSRSTTLKRSSPMSTGLTLQRIVLLTTSHRPTTLTSWVIWLVMNSSRSVVHGRLVRLLLVRSLNLLQVLMNSSQSTSLPAMLSLPVVLPPTRLQ